jgi:hypothetical protein
MEVYEIEKYKREIAIILQSEQYKDVDKIDKELLIQIIDSLKDSEAKIDNFINELNKPRGAGTYMV